MRSKAKIYAWIAFCLLAFGLTTFGFTGSGEADFAEARRQALLRKIGDELLRYSGDSVNRVPPVLRLDETTYRLRFEGLTFQTDTLVKIVGGLLTGHYNVSVIDCGAAQVVYGYAIAGNAKDDIVPCSGRAQPRNCYIVEITFKPEGVTAAQRGYLLGTVPLIAFAGFLWLKSRRKITGDEILYFGNTAFDLTQKIAVVNNEKILLTIKEASVLKMLAATPGEMIPRSQLQKEIWEDEGVIVGRSLDMFISKLRKKLAGDRSIEIKNIHGKGYVLQISRN